MGTQLESPSELTFRPLSSVIGVEAEGVDLSKPLDPEIFAELRRAWAEHSILLIRGLDLTEEDQFRFARNFGPIAARPKPPVEKRGYVPDPENPMHLVTDRVDDEGRRLGSLGHGEMWFHTDKCYVAAPHRASLLYAIEIPDEGGHTRFASLYNANENLPVDLRQKLEGRRALQVYDYTTTAVAEADQRLEDLLHHWQPVFVTNPDTGRQALYVNRLMTAQIDGMTPQESRETLDLLCDLIEAPDNVYEHVWRPGDIIVWDNLSSLHARTDWPEDQRRTLRRCTIEGEELQ
ncbi:MAG: taurine dioxygenase [Alphaproteobacteria bacterium]|jgi:taurine dioxygenase